MHCPWVILCVVRSTWVILWRVLHTHQFLVRYMQVNSHLLPVKYQGIQWQSTPAKHDKMHGHKKKIIFLFQSNLNDTLSNQMNAKYDNVIGFGQHRHNNLTHQVTQCARVLYHKVQLNWGASTSFSIANMKRSLHN